MFICVRARQKWLCGQVLYIIAASAAYFLFLLIISLLFTVFSGELSLDWGRTLNSVSFSTAAARKANAPYINVLIIIITFFKPLQAVWFTFLMSWLGGVFLGLLIFLQSGQFNKIPGSADSRDVGYNQQCCRE